MIWNYRVIKHTKKSLDIEETWYDIHEVFYDSDGKPVSCSVDPVAIGGDSPDDLANEMRHYVMALNKPVLDDSVFESPNGHGSPETESEI